MDVQYIYGVAIIALLTGIGEALKKAGLPKRFIPITVVFLGIGASVLSAPPDRWQEATIVGVTYGLSSCGLYNSTVKPFTKGV